MIDLMGLDAALHMAPEHVLYSVAYRPLRDRGTDQIESWPMPLALGHSLPTMPLSLEAELCIPVDLDAAYADACQRRRLDEALANNHR